MAKVRMSMRKAIAIFTPCITAVIAIMIAIAIVVSMFWQDISLWLYGRAQKTDAAVIAEGNLLSESIVEEGIVLLKNEEVDGTPALPLSKEEIARVNVFGWAAYDWMTMAFGSGYSNTKLAKTKLFPALEAAGIEYNKTLYDLYKNFYSDSSNEYNKSEDEQEYRGGVEFGSEKIFTLHEPNAAKYTDEIKAGIKEWSKVGLVVIGRTGSESKDLKLNQVRQNQNNKSNQTYTNKHYLELSPEEEDVIAVAKETCEKVIVILNTANTMETGFIDDEGIDGALLVGLTGLTGVNGLINVLRGEGPVVARDENGEIVFDEENGEIVYETDENGIIKMEPVSPSGRTADTYAYDILGTNPATANYGAESNDGAINTYSNKKSNGSQYRAYIDYSEGIYVGYKWYETADAEHYWDTKGGYDSVVQFPFGYGLSYTDFEWEVTKITVGGKEQNYTAVPELGMKDKIEITVKVTNKGNFPAKDVVELYYTPQYIKGGVEKAYVNLADFAKTKVIQPNESNTVTLTVTAQSMASYDCYDANKNGHTGYELDGGAYQLRLMKNAHKEGTMAETSKTEAVIEYTVPESGYNYDTDEKTGNDVENRFTNANGKGNSDAIDNGDLDGSRESTPVKYMSRADFAGTYPKKQNTARSMTKEAEEVARNKKPTENQLLDTYGMYYEDFESRVVTKNGLTLEDALGTEKYDAGIWSDLIANITNDELITLISDGYFKTAKLPSIGKDEYVDLDGPLGFNTRVTSGSSLCEFVAYPSATMLAQTWNYELAHEMGLSVGREAASMDGLKGWYAPGANIHRSPFGGRNGEYYSEDPVLSGRICTGTVAGAKEMGVYSYVKHFVVNDSEKNREGLFTFLTEQTLRETYLKPFEMMIKDGGGNALMTSMNRLGRVWSGANYGLMTQIVRAEWGFNGTAVTDWVNANDDYMPPYLGIWAGNDIWLSNGIGNLFSGLNEPAALTFAEKVAHDVLWTYVDTSNEMAKGAKYNLVWVAGVAVLEVAMLAGVGVMAFFMIRSVIAHFKRGVLATEGAAEDTAELDIEALTQAEQASAPEPEVITAEVQPEEPKAKPKAKSASKAKAKPKAKPKAEKPGDKE